MRFCHRGVLQFVIIKPIVATMDIIMIATKNKSKLGYEIFVFIIYNIRYEESFLLSHSSCYCFVILQILLLSFTLMTLHLKLTLISIY